MNLSKEKAFKEIEDIKAMFSVDSDFAVRDFVDTYALIRQNKHELYIGDRIANSDFFMYQFVDFTSEISEVISKNVLSFSEITGLHPDVIAVIAKRLQRETK